MTARYIEYGMNPILHFRQERAEIIRLGDADAASVFFGAFVNNDTHLTADCLDIAGQKLCHIDQMHGQITQHAGTGILFDETPFQLSARPQPAVL